MTSQVVRSPSPGELAFLDLRSEVDAAFFRRVYAELLETSFTADELEDEEHFESAFTGSDDDPLLIGLVAVAPDGTSPGDPVGVVIGEWYRASGVLLIGYIAVRPDCRGQRIGETLMRLALERWSATTDCALALAEVEDPRYFDEQEAISRLRFHGRAGGEVLSVPYFQPRLRPDARRVHHMLLVAFAVSDAARQDGGVDGSVLRTFLSQYIDVTEGADSLRSDPGVAWLLQQYESDVVPLVATSDYASVPHPEPPTAP